MENPILRTIGASVILAGLVVAGVVQMNVDEDETAKAIATGIPESTSVADDPAASSTSTTSKPEPFVYRIGVLSGASTTNFWAYYGSDPSVWNTYILGPTKGALFEVDPTTGELRSDLASVDMAVPHWNSDGWWVDVPLETDRFWSDGTPITARDLEFTFETVRALGLAGSWSDAFPVSVASVRAVDDALVRIEFNQRPNLAAWPHGPGLAPIMARHIWHDRVGDGKAKTLYAMSGDHDVSSGPLQVVTVDERLVASVRNPGYPGDNVADRVEYHVFDDEPAVVDALANGVVDTALTPKGLSPESVVRLRDVRGVETITSPGNGVRYLGFNLSRDPMTEHAFRNAIAQLVDRGALAERIVGAGDATQTFVSAANTMWYDSARAGEIATDYQGDVEANLSSLLAALKTAGYEWKTEPDVAGGIWTPGIGLTIAGVVPQPLTILTPGDAYDPARPAYVDAIAEKVRFLGFDVRTVETDFDTVVDLAFSPDDDGTLHYDMYVLGWTLGTPALPDFYRPLFAKGGLANNSGYQSDEFQRALEDFESAHDESEARSALWDMEEVLASDLPYLVLYTSQVTEAYRSDRVVLGSDPGLGGLQARLGAVDHVEPMSR